jgi:hypothetical protein
LERQANATLKIGYCGTNASFLFGAYPMRQEIIALK